MFFNLLGIRGKMTKIEKQVVVLIEQIEGITGIKKKISWPLRAKIFGLIYTQMENSSTLSDIREVQKEVLAAIDKYNLQFPEECCCKLL